MAWTDFLQFVVMMLGGLIVTVIGLHQVGGLHELMLAAPEKFKIIYPHHGQGISVVRGVDACFISVGIWYNCTNQFIVQRCLGARSEWDARMGVVFAGFMKILLPLLVVIPGIVAFKLFPGLKDTDQAFPSLVRELVPVGLSGVVMAGLAKCAKQLIPAKVSPRKEEAPAANIRRGQLVRKSIGIVLFRDKAHGKSL